MKNYKISMIFCILFVCMIPQISQSCTSFCLDTSDGPVFGTNLDFSFGEGLVLVNKRNVSKEGYMTSTNGKTAKWISKYGSITFNLAGNGFAWCGMNEAGLVISTMWLDKTVLPVPDSRPPVVSGFWVQYQLDNFSTIEEIIASDSLIRMQDDLCHFLVCGNTGDCVSIEFLDGGLVYHTRKSMPVKALTNTPYGETIFFVNQDSIPSPDDPSKSVTRFTNVAHKLNNYDPESSGCAVDYAMDILTNVVVASHTRWSIVFDILNRCVHFRTKTNQHVRCFDFDAFDFSCVTPVKMLDVNHDLSGDVANNFTEYSHQLNLYIFYNFCIRYGIDISLQEAGEFMQFLESYPCTK